MEYNWFFIFSILLNISLVLLLYSQSRELSSLRAIIEKQYSTESDEDLINLAKSRIDSLGMIGTVKYLREEKGLTLLKAKQIVDRISE